MYAILRGHSTAIRGLDFDENKQLVSGDDTGIVKIWNLQTRRAVRSWQAHSNAILTVKFFDDPRLILTHGRDNLLKLWKYEPEIKLVYEQDVNTLNFCPAAVNKTGLPTVLAVPATTDSNKVDIYKLDEQMQLSRPFKAIEPPHQDDMKQKKNERDQNGFQTAWGESEIDVDGMAEEMADGMMKGYGSVMQLVFVNEYCLISGYESGHLASFHLNGSIEVIKAHKSTILSMCFNNVDKCVYTSGADKRISRTSLDLKESVNVKLGKKVKLNGRAGSISINQGIAAAACWDNMLRVYTAGAEWTVLEEFSVNGPTVCQINKLNELNEPNELKGSKEVQKINYEVETKNVNPLKPVPRTIIACGNKQGQITLYDFSRRTFSSYCSAQD